MGPKPQTPPTGAGGFLARWLAAAGPRPEPGYEGLPRGTQSTKLARLQGLSTMGVRPLLRSYDSPTPYGDNGGTGGKKPRS